MSASDIQILDPDVAARIAAGEVVDRPASALKELLENALDAGAHRVEVRFEEGGAALLSVTDDGEGMPSEALGLSVARHATSKIRRVEDLEGLTTYGFRGEALAAVAAAARRLEIASRLGTGADGYRIRVEDGVLTGPEPIALKPGTRVVVEDLFGRLPARKAFLKSVRGETAALHDIAVRVALAAPELALGLTGERGEIFRAYGSGDRADVMTVAYGEPIRRALLPVAYGTTGIEIEGYLADPSFTRPTRSGGTLAVQGRVVESRSLAYAIESAYQGRLMRGRFPVYVLAVRVDPSRVDVNVHPQKHEVRFSDERAVYAAVHRACLTALEGRTVGFPVSSPRVTGGTASPSDPAGVGEAGLAWPSQGTGTGTATDTSPEGGEGESRGENPPGAPRVRTEPSTDSGSWHDPPVGDWLSGRLTPHQDARQSRRLPVGGPVPSDPQLEEGPVRTAEEEGPMASPRSALPLSPSPGVAPAYALPTTESRLLALRQVRLLYIVAESDQGLRIVDQHAASERVRYEELLEALRAGRAQVRQRLIAPLVLNVDPGLEDLCEKHQADLLDWGFEARPFGTGVIRVWAVPPGLKLATKALQELLHTFAAERDGQHERAALVACHTAARRGDPLSLADMQRLLDDLVRCEAPATCPHGRPTVRGWTWEEVARLFARRG